MKSGAIFLGVAVSAVLLAAAGFLYLMAAGGSGDRYRKSIDLVRRAQQISSDWSVEVAQVKSDPFADFDALSAFVPRMAAVKENLIGTASHIPDIPDRLVNNIHAYVNEIEAKEESIERFKTGYAVVRNSARYLPLAAASTSRQAQEAGDDDLARRISALVRDINLYLTTPTETAQTRLTEELDAVRAASLAYPPALSHAVANLLSHAEVLVAKQRSTEELFNQAISTRISDRTGQLVSSLEFELGKKASLAKYYNTAILAVFGILALFWILLAVQQRLRGGVLAAAPSPPPPSPVEAAPPPSPVEAAAALPEETGPALAKIQPFPPDAAGPAAQDATVPEGTRPSPAAASPPPGRQDLLEAAVVHGFVAKCVADTLAAAADQITSRVDYLRQTQDRIQEALRNGNAIPELRDGADLDEEVGAISAIASSVHQEAAGIADLARRLGSFSNSDVPHEDIERSMIDINTCVEEALESTGAGSVATVAKGLGDVPELFALKSEFLLLLAKILENSVLAVREMSGRKGIIKVDTAFRNGEIQITVIDNGDGIAPDRRGSIFKPFHTSRDGALGIGLSLAGYLARKYGGTIKINSLPGQGTVARITLPSGIPAP